MKTKKNVVIDLKDFGERVSVLRKTKKLSQETIAKELGYTRSNYSKIESGSINISIDAAFKLAQLFDVSIDYLVTGHNSPKVPDFGPFQEEIEQFLLFISKHNAYKHKVLSDYYTVLESTERNRRQREETEK
jgi:transcriptional regulator with XRE-family HTH domain